MDSAKELQATREIDSELKQTVNLKDVERSRGFTCLQEGIMSEQPNDRFEESVNRAAIAMNSRLRHLYQLKSREESISFIEWYMALLTQKMIDDINFTFDAHGEMGDLPGAPNS